MWLKEQCNGPAHILIVFHTNAFGDRKQHLQAPGRTHTVEVLVAAVGEEEVKLLVLQDLYR